MQHQIKEAQVLALAEGADSGSSFDTVDDGFVYEAPEEEYVSREAQF